MVFDDEFYMEVAGWDSWSFVCFSVEDVFVVVWGASFDWDVNLGCLHQDLLSSASITLLPYLLSLSITLFAGLSYMLIHSRSKFNHLFISPSSFAIGTGIDTDTTLSVTC
jgi:hypothetical protein